MMKLKGDDEITEELQEKLLDRLMLALLKVDCPELEKVKLNFSVILDSYDIRPKEKAVAIYTGGKNELYLKRFLLSKAVAGCTQRTLLHYKGYMERLFRKLEKDVDTWTASDIQIMLARIIQNTSNLNADNCRRVLSSFFTWMQREELITKNPMNRVEHIKFIKKPKYAFTEMDIEKIREACRSNRERAIVEILLSTGCRVNELSNIKISDVEGDEIMVLGKGNKYRTVYLNAKGVMALQKYLAERNDTNPYVFPKAKSVIESNYVKMSHSEKCEFYKNPDMLAPDDHMDKSSIGNLVRNIGKRAGVEHTHPHRFRRTCATFALRRGMPIEQVSKMLGHESIETTQIYLDLTKESLAAAHRKYVV